MNLTFPIADWLFGTSDLNRGLLGHLFNGYDTRHLKKNLRGSPSGRTRRPPRRSATTDGSGPESPTRSDGKAVERRHAQ